MSPQQARKSRKSTEGSVFRQYRTVDGKQVADGWIVSLYVSDPLAKGGKKRIRRVARTREAATQLLDQLKTESKTKTATVMRNEHMRVADYVDIFTEETLPLLDMSESAKQSYRDYAKNPLKPTLADVTLAEFPKVAKRWLVTLSKAQTRQGSTLSGATQRKAFYCLKRILNEAVKEEYMTANPLILLDAPRAAKTEVPFTDPDTFDLVISPALEGARIETLVMLVAHTGCRVGEARGLRWQDVDLNAGTVTFTRSKADTDRTKTGVVRTVPLTDEAIALLKAWRKTQAQEHLAVGAGWQDKAGLIFTTAIGTPIDEHNARRDYVRILNELNLPTDRPFHSLRHSYATRWIRAGKNIESLSAILGHASIKTTYDIYGHAKATDYADDVRSLFAKSGA